MADKEEADLIASAPMAELPAEVKAVVAAGTTPTPPEDPHLGKVKRVLTARDRNLILSALQQICNKKECADAKGQRKFKKLTVIIDTEGSEDYFDMITEDMEERVRKWAKNKKEWLDGKSVENPGKQPEGELAAMSGPTNTYWIPAKLDVWMVEAVEGALWNPHLNEYVIQLLDTLGIKDE